MIALVTGVSAGFGKELSRLLVARGHSVIGTARRRDRLRALEEELGAAFYPLAFDICDFAAMDAALAGLPEKWREIDLLVNNAGLALGLKPAFDSELCDWEKMIDTNVKGLVAITHKILPGMVARDRGHIVNLASIAGTYPYYGGNVYGATKAFVTQFSLNLRADLIGKKVRVSNIEPGVIAGTEFSTVRFHGDDRKAAEVYRGFTNMTARDIAEIIVWIAEQPQRININRIEIMPLAQTFAGLTVTGDGKCGE